MHDSEALNKAADIIEAQGWTVGEAGTRAEFGPRCALGAIGQAVGHTASLGADGQAHYNVYTTDKAPPATITFARYCMEKRPNPWDEVSPPPVSMAHAWAFNDKADSAEQVVAELRACALIEAAKAEEKAEA